MDSILYLLVAIAVLQPLNTAMAKTVTVSEPEPSAQRATRFANIRFSAPPDRGAPRSGRARGGASRGNCPTSDLPLTTLVPLNSPTDTTGSVGLTTSTHPTFWFYLPFPLSPETAAEFLLLDEDGNSLYNTTLSDSQGRAGVMKIAIPNTTPALTVNKTYTWLFQVNCGVGNPISTWGEIARVELNPSVITQLQQASTQEQAALYAENGIWYEALTTLAELRLAEPNNPIITTDWKSLLESAGLVDVAEQPLLDCCFTD
jgi:hypothetical protein